MFKIEDFNARIQSQIRAQLSAGGALPDAEQRQCAPALARGDAGETPRPRCPHCCFTLVRRKLLDVDAKYASVKDLLDGLAIAGIVEGDKEGQITLEVNQRKAAKGEAEFTEISVYESHPG